ncbi:MULTISPECIES: Xaa-Pro dipeptidyl-peptidase [Bacillus]|uniref:Xaa-Pro dipeptidyl-peptidase n=1 Tax=Bacillus TaxID=1386 RepID=UPI00046A8D6E|nr:MULTISPECIES: Xaa-Pro dipeptidyl-peptidase [Bacillus]MED1410572.1 Xaa-Pro dipeptidyl-peptidase [Bacillus paramycoides]MED1466516.1 Xaa-Pro dipeptidyl-peptidase [Bacillus paramycoides]MED1492390.1 Xaa-Pro dipeptidyl-peptidase [Bacillus paramycoides]
MEKKKLAITLSTILSLTITSGVSNMTAHSESKEGASVKGSDIKLNGQVSEALIPNTKIELENGMTKPIYSLDESIIENLFVETEVDSDRDGKKDRVSIKVMRPKTDPNVKVPVIYEMSPYRAGLKDVPVYNVDEELYAYEGKPYAAVNLGSYGNYYVPRGYAVILGESIGTGKSDGCPTTGDEQEILGTKSVIDWVNGRAKAYTEDGKEVNANWSTGNVGMTGASYNGTLPNAVATTGVEGLKTIIPIAAISSWYDYYRANGAVIAPGGYQGEDTDNMAEAVLTRKNPEVCGQIINELTAGQNRKTGDYNDFWGKRNYVKDAKNVKASVFVVHGLNDWNVKTKQFAQWWEALGENNVPRKMWLHQGGHGGTTSNNWQQTQNKWFDYWLYGIENGIMDEPMVDVQRENKTWQKIKNWPDPAAVPSKIRMYLSNKAVNLPLSMGSVNNVFSFVDDAKIKSNQLVENPELEVANRLVYTMPVLQKDMRISGTPKISFKGNIDRSVSNLTALLVDYGGAKPEIVTRGWMDPQNLNSINNSTVIQPGKDYTFTWDMQPDDYVFKEGHQIGVVLIASDYDYTIRPKAGTKLTVKLSEVTLPIVK